MGIKYYLQIQDVHDLYMFPYSYHILTLLTIINLINNIKTHTIVYPRASVSTTLSEGGIIVQFAMGFFFNVVHTHTLVILNL